MALAGQYAQMYTLQASRFGDDPTPPPHPEGNGHKDTAETALPRREGAGG